MSSYHIRGGGGPGFRGPPRGGFSQDTRGGPGGGGRSRGGGGGGYNQGRGGAPSFAVSRDKAQPVTVQTNCFTITKLPQKLYFQYDMFDPEINSFGRRQEIFDRLVLRNPETFYSRALYDGKVLVYSPRRLTLRGGDTGTFLVTFSDRAPPAGAKNRGVEVTLKLTAGEPVRPSDLEQFVKMEGTNTNISTAINLLQLIIRQDSNQKFPHNARAFFSGDGKLDVGGGIELWRGFFQSVRPTKDKMLVNIDTTMAAVIKGGRLIDLCLEVLGFQNARDLAFDEKNPNYRKLETFLKKKLIILHTINKAKVIYGLVPYAGRYQFAKDGVTMTVEEYFKSAYSKALQFPNIVGVRLTKPDAERQVIVPLEVCDVKGGQFYKQRLPDQYTASAVKFATLPPAERLNAILGRSGNAVRVHSPITSYGDSEFIKESGMEIDTTPITIRGQLLALPKVQFQRNEVLPSNGSWNVMNQTFFKSVALKCWAIVNFAERLGPHYLSKVERGIMDSCSSLGMNIGQKAAVQTGSGQAAEKVLNTMMSTLSRVFPDLGNLRPPPMLIVILPQNAAELRYRVKHWSDVTTGVLTQCIREGKIERANSQYWNNIALKLNARLSGSNFVVRSPAMENLKKLGKFIIMGADVAHPGPGVLKPSTASLVWSRDAEASSYTAFVEVQPPRLEIIQNLQQMVHDALMGFGKANGSPQTILFFRDGVSEGEFETVSRHEIQDIRDAIDNVWTTRGIKDPKPKLTFIVVGKRHHIVFFPTRDSFLNDGKGNCLAGFASNQEDLSHPSTTDFYLQSHGAIQGTSRSGHYTVIQDEIFNNDVSKIQDVAFSLCHVYAKATRSVSIPAPVYYADIACARSAFHISPDSRFHLNSDASSTSSGHSNFDIEEWKREFKKPNRVIASSMYFL